jgi:hypothetical protein
MKELPIACTLGPGDGAARLAEWRRLSDSRLDAQRDGRTLVVTYREDASADLTRLVEAERTCCAFLDWSLEHAGDRAILKVRSDEAGEPEIARLAELFGASGR